MATGRERGRPASSIRTPRQGTAGAAWASTPAVRGRMQRQQIRDTAPELAVRHILHAAGLRYRVDVAPLQGFRRRADIVFGPAMVSVLVDGCFWHGCLEQGSRRTTANSSYWKGKIERNQRRDTDTDARLAVAGWLSIRVLEHDNPECVAKRVLGAVLARRSERARGTATERRGDELPS